MKKFILFIIGTFVGMGYYHYTHVASLVGSRAQSIRPMIQRAAAQRILTTGRPSALTSPLARQGLFRSFSQIGQRDALIGNRMMMRGGLGQRIRHMSQVSQRIPYSTDHLRKLLGRGTVITDRLKKLLGREIVINNNLFGKRWEELQGKFFENGSSEVTTLMLNRAGIAPESVKIIEYAGDEIGGKAIELHPELQAEVGYKWLVIIPRILLSADTIDPLAMAVAAHEFMHIMYNHEGREQGSLEARLAAAMSGDVELYNQASKQHKELSRKSELEADDAARYLFQELDVAYYMSLTLHDCLANEYGNEAIEKLLTKSESSTYPLLSERRDLSIAAAEEQAQRRLAEQELARKEGPMFGPLTRLQLMRNQYRPVKVPASKGWLQYRQKALGDAGNRLLKHIWGIGSQQISEEPSQSQQQ